LQREILLCVCGPLWAEERECSHLLVDEKYGGIFEVSLKQVIVDKEDYTVFLLPISKSRHLSRFARPILEVIWWLDSLCFHFFDL